VLLWEAHKDGICRMLSGTPINFCVKIDSAMKKIGKSTNSIESFSNALLGVANETIPKTSMQAHKRSVPWFNDSCKMAVAERKKSLHAFTNNPTNLESNNVRIFRAKALRTIKQNKSHCWRSYVSKLNSQTPMKKIWQMIRRINGKPSPAAISHLKINNTTIEQLTEIDCIYHCSQQFVRSLYR